MSSSDSEQTVAFQIAIGSSPVEALQKPPELPRHLQMRMQSYVCDRPRKTIGDRMEEAEKRRQRHFARRAQNARLAEERCRRIAEAMDAVTDYNRHLEGEGGHGRAPRRSEMKALYANIKEDLQVVIGRVNREAMRMEDRSYVHTPVTYRPRRRNTHTANCTCECCYLEDEEKMSRMQKNLAEILSEVCTCSGSEDERRASGDMEEEKENHRLPKPTDGHCLGFASHAILDIPACRGRRRVVWADEAGAEEVAGAPRCRSQASFADLAVGPDAGVQTEDVCCPGCAAVQQLAGLARASQTGPERRDAASQTEPEDFACLCCQRRL